MITLSPTQARQMILHSQGLSKKHFFGKGQAATLKAIQQLGYIQIDTISVIRRAHHHTLWTRQAEYDFSFLNQLSLKQQIFEYWSHAAAYLPIEDYRFALPRMHTYRSEQKKFWFEVDKKMSQFVLDRIKAEGPLMARDFKKKANTKSGPWWDWKPAKQALDKHFWTGELMIKERKNFQKVYDLTERVLHPNINTKIPNEKEIATHLIKKTIQAQGLATINCMSYLRKGIKKAIQKQVQEMTENNKLITLNINNKNYYTFPHKLELADQKINHSNIHILCPFDNSIIQRKRCLQFFEHDYKLECYVPAAKRIFGYYTCPIIWGNQLVALIDPKADRKEKILYIKNYISLPSLKEKEKEKFKQSLHNKLEELAKFNNCEKTIWL